MEKISPQTIDRAISHSSTISTTTHGSTDRPPREFVRAINALVKSIRITWGYYLRGAGHDDERLAKRLWARDLIDYGGRPEIIFAGIKRMRTACTKPPAPAEFLRILHQVEGKPLTPAHRVIPRSRQLRLDPDPKRAEEFRQAMRDAGLMR